MQQNNGIPKTDLGKILTVKKTDFIIKYDMFILQRIQRLNVARKIPQNSEKGGKLHIWPLNLFVHLIK